MLPVSRLLADAALSLGGSDLFWYKARFCPYIKDDGTPCYNEGRGSPWIECPVCGGTGAVYDAPKYIKGIYIDKSNVFYPDGSGGFLVGEKSLSLPMDLDIKILKPREAGVSRRLLRDKFVLLGECCNEDGSRAILETLYAKDDPVYPTVNSGHIYMTLNVANNY